jgi:ABC-2 type transport system permease protein
MAPNPFVILADATSRLPPQPHLGAGDEATVAAPDLLEQTGVIVRQLRLPPEREEAALSGTARSPAVWPYGLAANLALGTAALAVTARRLQIRADGYRAGSGSPSVRALS